MLIGCAPKPFEPFTPPTVSFEPTPAYSIDLDSIPKPLPPDPIFLNDQFEEVAPNQATMILLTTDEYSKVGALAGLTAEYRRLIEEQEDLINIKINTINSFKEYLELEQQKSLAYKELWVNAENIYRQEQYRIDIERR
jgi:hypothetical protein